VSLNPTQRFSNRVADYVSARPSYPAALLDLLAAECGLGPGADVADVGAGTGILTRLLLERGARVFAVEPNGPMRAAAAQALGDRPGFVGVAATAEATTLPDASIDLITASQAFHWFEPAATRREWARILRPGGNAALIWNDRHSSGSPFAEEYEQLLVTHGDNYTGVNYRRTGDAQVRAFFGGDHVRRAAFPWVERFDLDKLQRRLLSASYAPVAGQPGHEAMLAALHALFARHQRDGAVELPHDTVVYYGPLR
jgi:SAM-dependent methyltransferase